MLLASRAVISTVVAASAETAATQGGEDGDRSLFLLCRCRLLLFRSFMLAVRMPRGCRLRFRAVRPRDVGRLPASAPAPTRPAGRSGFARVLCRSRARAYARARARRGPRRRRSG